MRASWANALELISRRQKPEAIVRQNLKRDHKFGAENAANEWHAKTIMRIEMFSGLLSRWRDENVAEMNLNASRYLEKLQQIIPDFDIKFRDRKPRMRSELIWFKFPRDSG